MCICMLCLLFVVFCCFYWLVAVCCLCVIISLFWRGPVFSTDHKKCLGALPKFARISPEFRLNLTGSSPGLHRNFSGISPELHRNFARISNWSSVQSSCL